MIPKQCILWKKKKLTPADVPAGMFEGVSSLPEIPHISERLLRCKECGQLYLFEYNDFFANYENDLPVYMTYVPVSEEELKEHLKVEKTMTSIFSATKGPKLLYDVKEEGENVRWSK